MRCLSHRKPFHSSKITFGSTPRLWFIWCLAKYSISLIHLLDFALIAPYQTVREFAVFFSLMLYWFHFIITDVRALAAHSDRFRAMIGGSGWVGKKSPIHMTEVKKLKMIKKNKKQIESISVFGLKWDSVRRGEGALRDEMNSRVVVCVCVCVCQARRASPQRLHKLMLMRDGMKVGVLVVKGERLIRLH